MDKLRRALTQREACAIVGVGGMGGVGKSELALYLAHELDAAQPGSVIWVTVADRSLEAVQGDLANAMGLIFPPTADAESRASLLRAALNASPKTIFLDDVRPPFLDCLGDCLPPSPPCAALVTSRQHDLPGLAAGAVYALDVMEEGQALALLHAVNGLTEALDAEQEATLALVKASAYHPLALDLAARRLLGQLHFSAKPVAYFTDGLKDRMRQLRRTGARNAPLLSLEANFDLSYNVLSKEDQRCFCDLAVFTPTGFGLTGAAAVWGQEEDIAAETILRLEGASLLLPGAQPGRWRLHDLLREYAQASRKRTGAPNTLWWIS